VHESSPSRRMLRLPAIRLSGAALGVLALAGGVLQAATATLAVALPATTYVVNTTADGIGLGNCKAHGTCTLRQAIDQYNADTTGADTITFSVPTPADFNIQNDGSLLTYNTSGVPLTIVGAGALETSRRWWGHRIADDRGV
jgi:hypothetical protein